MGPSARHQDTSFPSTIDHAAAGSFFSPLQSVILIKKNFFKCLFLRETERARVGEGQREREREGDTESDASEPDTGLEPTSCEIVT